MTLLDRLAAHCGIEAEFEDGFSKTHRLSPETQRALLAAMGVQARDDEEVSTSLENITRAEWGGPLPPVRVAYADAGPVTVALTFPTDVDRVSWQIVLETDGVLDGQAAFGTLELIEQYELDGLPLERRTLTLGVLPWGYHRLTVQPGGAEAVLIVTPGRCWFPEDARGSRFWGVAVQLYLTRSASNWGIGDYGDLHYLVELLAERGADVVGLNPLHAMFLDDPEHASPYSPASRLLLNVLNIDVSAIPELSDCAPARELTASSVFQQSLEHCRAATLVDYTGVTDLKLRVLRVLFDAALSASSSDRWRAFEAFRREQGDTLERSCLFQVLRQHFAAKGRDRADWHAWPAEYRDPDSTEVARFAQEHERDISFQTWLQWIADTQLAGAAEAAKGMKVGLYRDLAVGADISGAETWLNQRCFAEGVQVGAPPDPDNEAGQGWGLPAFDPTALRYEGYFSFIRLLRANMRHAGGLRIDHVMALLHLYWIPAGQSSTEGGYVRYPIEDLVGILALESHRNRCLVVGEDLGTVPKGFRERMAAANILSYRVLLFEKDDEGEFLPPERYPTLALAVAGNHDLPTLRGWWEERDIDLKRTLRSLPDPDEKTARLERSVERERLVRAFRRATQGPDQVDFDAEDFIRTAHTFLARSEAVITLLQIDDMTDEVDPVNVPGTSDEHPNWRRRLSVPLDELAGHARFNTLMQTLASGRSATSPVQDD